MLFRNLRFAAAAALMFTSVVSWAEMKMAWVLESPQFSETIVSSNPSERDTLVKGGWSADASGMMRADWTEGAGPLHRLSRSTPKGVERVLETDVAQLPVWQKAGFTDEGLIGYVADADGADRIAVVQFSKEGRKLWVVSEAAQKRAEQDGWTRQGVHFWLWSVTAK